jgi:drug/metabolite transporter (DMT)-like permease
MKSENQKWYLLGILALVWGSSFILMKRGLEGLTAFQLGSLRIVFCALFLFAMGFRKLAAIPSAKWKYIALTALFGTFLPVYLFAYAQTGIHSSVSAILNSLNPLNTLLLGALVFGLQFRKRQLLGVLTGLCGCVLLIYSGSNGGGGANIYALFVVVASGCYAININLIKKYLSDLTPLSISVGNFAVLVVPAAIVLFCSGFAAIAGNPAAQQSMAYIAILGIVGTGMSNILYFRLIQIASPIFASSVTYLIPVVACGWGLLDGERLSLWQGVGAATILAGVYFSAKK